MATKHYSGEDLQRIPIAGLRLENLSSDPASGQPGDLYFNLADGYPKVCLSATGPTWAKAAATSIVDADIASGAAIALSKLATDPLARANHTGTQTASTISDFDTQVRTSRLDQMASPTSALGLGGQRATNAADPTGSTDLTTQQWVTNYVDTRVNGQDWKASVRAIATGNISTSSAPSSIDGVTLSSSDRVLLVGQSTASQNGIYTFASAGAALTRATDADASAEVTAGMTVPVTEGTTYGDTVWLLTTNDAITLGSTSLAFTQISGVGAYAAGTGLTLTGNTFALSSPVSIANGGTNATSAATARSNLGAAQKGFASDIGALTAGVGLAIAHGLATADVVVTVRDKSTGAVVDIDVTIDSTNLTVTSANAVSSGVLRICAVPAV